jgi:hypothetical protein
VGVAKALYVGTTANVAGAATLGSTLTYGGVTLTNAVTGTGKMVLDTSPTLVTPVLGTPTSGNLVNCTGLDYDGFKNRIINGAMVIDQRNAGASVTANDGFYLDRWKFNSTQNGKGTIQQNAGAVTPPAGFINYFGFTSTSAYSVLSTDSIALLQNIEGFNTADLGFGAAGASNVTLSFWVRSSLTGTFGGALENASVNRAYPFTYTISSSNTWEYKTITVVGDTTGTWGTGNGVGIRVWLNLGAGSTFSGTAGAWAAADYRSATGATSVVGTNGATFYITGVQLEKGSTATTFDYRPYGTEFQLCQRYYETFEAGASNTNYAVGFARTTTTATFNLSFKVPKRATDWSGSVSGTLAVESGGSDFTLSSPSFFNGYIGGGRLNATSSSVMVVGIGCAAVANSAKILISSEL